MSSLSAECWWTLSRTVILCLLAWPLIVGIERWLQSLSDVGRPFAFVVLLTPFLFPELLVGYAYRTTALAAPKWAEFLCASLLFVRIVPVGVVALMASPATIVSPSAIHCRWMLLRANPRSPFQWKQILWCYLNGPIRRALPALGLMSLVASQEFELSALLQTASWTDWFIQAQRAGLKLSVLVRQSLKPLIMQLPLVAGACVWLVRTNGTRSEQNASIPQAVSLSTKVIVGFYLGCALIYGSLIPLGVLARNLPSGLMLLVRQSAQFRGLGREILIATMISLAAGATAWTAGKALIGARGSGGLAVLSRWMLLIPGLIGTLLLSLATVVVFQQPWLRPLYDTPIPWALALVVWLLPRAILLHLWVDMHTLGETVYVAQMLADRSSFANGGPVTAPESGFSANAIGPRLGGGGGPRFEEEPGPVTGSSARGLPQSRSAPATPPATPSRRPFALLFRMKDQPQLLAVGLLCFWAYTDLSTAYLLAPSSMNSGLVKLYDFMHFGRSAALSAEAFCFFGAPPLAMFLAERLLKTMRLF